MASMSWFLAELQACCPALRSVWMIGEYTGSAPPRSDQRLPWDLVGFADAASLERLRGARHLHRANMCLRIVTDGDRFGVAWGEGQGAGALSQWDWVQVNEREAFYSEAHWREPAAAGHVERTRRKALCLWQSALSP
jgi:hypothetical protein